MSSEVYQSALRMLARREHSCFELSQKLQQRDYSLDSITSAIEKLRAENYLNDERFAEIFMRSQKQKGHGPIRIKFSLKERGIKEDLIEKLFAAEENDWLSHAIQVRQKRFGAKQPKDLKDKAKQTRFLQYRGFSFELINTLWRIKP